MILFCFFFLETVLMNPAMYNIARVLIFSVLSALFSEMLGFKLKLWKLLKVK